MNDKRPPRIHLNRDNQGTEQSKPPRINLNPPSFQSQQPIAEEHSLSRIHLSHVNSEPFPVSPVDPYAVILGLDTLTNQPISVHQTDLCEGTYIVGVPGMGKTSLLEQIIYQQMQRDEAIICIDPHGDLVNSIIAHIPANKLRKTYLLDLKDRDYPFGLSVFACSNPTDEEERDTTRNQIMHAFEKLWPETKEGQYFKKILRHVVVTLIENPQLTLANVKRLLFDKNYRQHYTSHLHNSETRSFWKDEYDQLSESKRTTETNPLRGRLDELLTEPVIKSILQQTQKTVNIRALIEERAILLVKLPVNEPAFVLSAPIMGTLLMAMIYAAIFSFADIPTLADRPGCTLVVDEFQNFATDEYATLFEQGRKYKVKQFLAHQHRQQFQRQDTSSTNLAASLSAHTIVAFRTVLHDSTELASLFLGSDRNRRPTNFYLYPTEKLFQHANPTVKVFTRDVVDTLDSASGGKLSRQKDPFYAPNTGRLIWVNTSTVYPKFDFGEGQVAVDPAQAEAALKLLDKLIYESEAAGQIVQGERDAFLQAVAKFWKFENYVSGQYDNAEERERYRQFAAQLDSAVNILIREPIAQDSNLSTSDIAKLLEHQQKRHAFIKNGTQAFQIETRETQLLQTAVTQAEAAQRYSQVQAQTRKRYCVPRSELDEREEDQPISQPEQEETNAERTPRQIEEPQPEPVTTETHQPEPIQVPEPAIQPSAPPAPKAPERQQPAHQPASRDTANILYPQLKAKAIDPETTILAALGDHYVLTIKQWMRLYEWGSYPRATKYFKELKDNDLIYRKDREGRGGTLAQGDWFFLLNKGANELQKRKQANPLFSLEPNEAEKASGDTLFHTYLVNELLIHLRLLERSHPDLFQIQGIDHERSMRRNYLTALGSDTRLYPDGFLRLLVPTANGLKRRYLFLELQHTTQKDKHNWQTKVRKYLNLFEHTALLERFFSTRTPQVLVITMDGAFVAYHKAWTEEVLAETGDKGRSYSNRFLIGAYDKGISDMTTTPEQFFCTPRYAQPFQHAAFPVFDL